jgi:type IV pilus assembly protein PilW
MGVKNKMKGLFENPETPASGSGFTLIEVLVAIAISGILMVGVYSSYFSQQKSYTAQEQVTSLQQNLRAAMYLMEKEIRMAACDPTGNAGAAIINAGENTLQFSEDISDVPGTGDPDGLLQPRENITYALDVGNRCLTRDNGGGAQTIAENIEAINFVYLDADGNETATIAEIRAVQIAILARADKSDPGYARTETFNNLQGDTLGTYTDNYRRKLLTAQVKCRNLGL